MAWNMWRVVPGVWNKEAAQHVWHPYSGLELFCPRSTKYQYCYPSPSRRRRPPPPSPPSPPPPGSPPMLPPSYPPRPPLYEYEDNEVMTEFKQMAYARSTYLYPSRSEWGASFLLRPGVEHGLLVGLGTPSNGTTWLAPHRRAAGPGCDPELRKAIYLQWRPQKSRIGGPAVTRTTTCMDLNWCGMPARASILAGPER